MNESNSFDVKFFLPNGTTMTPQGFKNFIEEKGFKVSLPMSHGDAITIELAEKKAEKAKDVIHEHIPPHFMNEKPPKERIFKASKPAVKKKR